ncbi:MAG: glutamine synthetase type III [Planctomycetota bacterium]|nr:MAG: glutamine synthetase type III [Planctomycetota bacterium]
MSSSPRQSALSALASRVATPVAVENGVPATELFGMDVFDDAAQRQRLPKPVYKALRRTIERGEALDASIADAVASAMKEWALENGATHFTHWFQPMTGLTAEKHDAFLVPVGDGSAIAEFSGKELIRGEPDASSFPSGGIRATFEARGYTAWDPTSPAFLRRNGSAATLTIPTAFCSWTGEALDLKTPLLRSAEALDKQARRLLALLGDGDAKRVFPTLGVEQEYFLIDASLWQLRPDLVACGRTLIGSRPPKGQELEDHYFAATPERVMAYMIDCERQLWRLGIPAKTRHNEVAPAQYEMAPIFEPAPVAIDHNMLCMEIMQSTAERHGMKCLLHEKPFAGVNGSGKHNNWSLADDRGNNLLDPGHTPHENLKFMVFLSVVLRAVDTHQDMLRASIAHAGNDHRLGANEAPPAIISVFLGEELESLVRSLIGGTELKGRKQGALELGVTTLPPLPRDTSDRNRTSPFAFTGNKFEFRAVGSSQSCAYPNIVLNSAAADAIDHVATEIEKRLKGKETDRRAVIEAVVRETLKKHERILFNGDGYSSEWQDEAARRGLLNRRDTPSALADFGGKKNAELFERLGVLNRRELESRQHVLLMAYSHRVNVEAHSLANIASTIVLPAAQKAAHAMAQSLSSVRAAAPKAELGELETLLTEVASKANQLKGAADRLAKATAHAHESDGDALKSAEGYRDKVVPAMRDVRGLCDQLEALIGDEHWPLPKYRELLFLK